MSQPMSEPCNEAVRVGDGNSGEYTVRCSLAKGHTGLHGANYDGEWQTRVSHPNPVSQPLASEGPETPRDDVFFTVDGDSFNLSQIYRDRGYKVLPATLTIYGDLLRAIIPTFDQSYAVYLERPGQDDKLLAPHESVVVPNGTRFYTLPPASYVGGRV